MSFEIGTERQLEMFFSQLGANKQELAQQYSGLIASFIDQRYECYYDEMTQSKAIDTFLLAPT